MLVVLGATVVAMLPLVCCEAVVFVLALDVVFVVVAVAVVVFILVEVAFSGVKLAYALLFCEAAAFKYSLTANTSDLLITLFRVSFV